MNRTTKTYARLAGAVCGLVLAGAAVGLVLHVARPAADPLIVKNATALLHDPRTQVLGDPRGDVTLVEFFDYNCPDCRATEPRVEQLLHADPRVRLMVKEYPVLSPGSVLASRAALAAVKQGKYAAFHQALLAYRGELDAAAIDSVAQDVGLDTARLHQDMDDPAIAGEIAADLSLADAIHAHGTPIFILDGRRLNPDPSRIDFPAVIAAARRDRNRAG